MIYVVLRRRIIMISKDLLPRMRLSSSRTLSSQIYDFLRKQIIERRIVPGTALSENDLASHFCVSRNPVHEALNKLNAIGLVDILPQKGSFVSKISVNHLFEICFVRCALESQCIRKSVNFSEKKFERICKKLEKNLEQQTALLQKDEINAKFLALDDAFHSILCQFSETELVWDTIMQVKANMDRIRYLSIGTFSSIDHLLDMHRTIFEAIRERRADEACRLLEEHSYEISHTYVQIMEKYKDWFLTE